MKEGYMYILKCANGSYYTGSTTNLERRLAQHQRGEGANFTKKHLPVELVYFEKFSKISDAFYREKQVQGWNRAKKEALIKGDTDLLHKLAECRNQTHYKKGTSTSLSAHSTSLSAHSAALSAPDMRSLSEAKTTRSLSEAKTTRSLSEAETNATTNDKTKG